MRLSLDVISEQLTGTCSVKSLYTPDNDPALYDFPTLYDPESSFCQDALYISVDSNLPKEPWLRSKFGLIVIGQAPEAYILQNCSVLCVENTITETELFAAVATIFWKFQQWTMDLKELLSQHALLQEYLDLTISFVCTPLFIGDKHGNILAHTEIDQYGNKNSQTSFDGNTPPFEELFPSEDFLSKWSMPVNSFETTFYVQGSSWLCYFHKLINESDEYLGYVMTSSNKGDISKTSKFLINILSRIVQKAFSEITEMESNQMWKDHYLFKDIMNDIAISHAEYSYRLKEQKLYGHRYCCVKLIMKQSYLALPAEAICRQINRSIPQTFAMVYDASIVLFLILPTDVYILKELPEEIQKFIKDKHFVAGISHTFATIRDAKYYYYQACNALKQGSFYHPDRDLNFFSDYALECIAGRNSAEQPPRTLCMEGIKYLRDYDREKRSEYCRTLKTYFENSMNLQQTAKDLFIHRSTLTYRLKKIKEDAGINLDDYKCRLYAMLSLELLEL